MKTLEDSIGLLCDIDLEADLPEYLVRVGLWEGNDSDEVHEWRAALAIIYEASLAFLVGDEMLF